MSTNNQLHIIKEGKKYNIYENHCVDNDFIPSKEDLLETKTSLKKAIKFANQYCSENIVEYGYSVEGI